MASLVPQRLKQQRKAGSWPLLPRKYIEGQSVSLSDLPEEVLEIIFLHVQDPSKLVRGCRSLHGVGNKALVRVRWLLARWGRANAFQGALRWTKILDSETLELLLKAVPVVPRYIIQRALTRFQHVNKADLIAPLMTYGLTHYHNLSLHKHDGQCFKDLLPFASSSLLQQMTFFTQTRLDVIDELVNVYNFNVNFCKWNPNTGLPMMATNEGFRVFLSAVASGNEVMVKALLKHKMQTHVERYCSPMNGTGSRSLYQSVFPLFEATPQWEDSFFQPELRTYMKYTVEALVLATKNKHLKIMQMLLEHDSPRWGSENGAEVLKATLQLAVDETFAAGISLVTEYIGSYPPPPKSPLALKRALYHACLENDLKALKALIKEGATTDGGSGEVGSGPDPMKHVILCEKTELLNYLIRTLDFSQERLSELLTFAIDNMSITCARYLLTNRTQRPIVIEKHLRRCVVHASTSLLPLILRCLHIQQPDKLMPGFTGVLRLAIKRANAESAGQARLDIVEELQAYKEKIDQKFAAKKGKSKSGAAHRRSAKTHYTAADLGITSTSSIAKPSRPRTTRNSQLAGLH